MSEMTFLDRLRASFAWRVVRTSAVWTYSENAITGQRKAFKYSSCHQPVDHDFLREGDKVIDESGARLVVNIPAVQRPPTGGSGVRMSEPAARRVVKSIRILEPGETPLPDCPCDGPYYGTDDKTLDSCRLRFDNIRNFQHSPTLYRTAGKEVLEGTEHYADARDEVAAAVIAKALNGGAR